MQKFTAWLRRHKNKFFDIGIVIGLALIVWAFFNAPVNINRMQPGDWKDAHIQKIGVATIQKIQAHAPYVEIKDVDRIPGIGPVKMAQVQRYFTTWDTAKSDAWYILDVAGLIIFFGCLYCRLIIAHKQHDNAKDIKKTLFGDKNVKR